MSQILSKSNIYDLLHWVVSNMYFHNGDLTFHQTVGLPMGTNAAPLLANLGLYRHERDFVSSHQDDTVISTFNNALRFIDDILLIDLIIASINILSQHLMILTLSTRTICNYHKHPLPQLKWVILVYRLTFIGIISILQYTINAGIFVLKSINIHISIPLFRNIL